MDDDLVCSDLCEEHGFLRQAELLRALAGGGRAAYVVMERGAEYNDEIMDPDPEGEPRAVFLDRQEAERVAAARNAEWHRQNSIFEHCYSLRDATDLPEGELERRISGILGRPYHLPKGDGPSLAVEPATDEQMIKIAALFTLKFYYVVETRFAAPGGPLPLADEPAAEEPRP